MPVSNSLRKSWKDRANSPECAHGHAYTLENTRYRKDRNGYLYRQCRACDAAQQRAYTLKGKLTENKVRVIFQALAEGKTLSNIIGVRGNRYVGSQIIGSTALFAFMKVNPKVAVRMRLLSKKNALATQPPRLVAAPALMKNNGHSAYDAIIAATRNVFVGIRQDVMGDLFIAVGEGRLKLHEIVARLPEFVAAHNKREKLSVFSKYGHLSLDKPIFDDENGSQYDRIAEDRGLWK